MHCLCCLSLLSLCCLSLLSLDLGLCHGFLLSLRPCVGLPSDLLHRGGLLLKSGGPLLRRGGLLLGSGGLLLCHGERLLRPGGLQSRLLRPGGLQSRLLHPGGLQVRPLHPGGLQVHSHSIHSHSTSTWTWPSVPPPVPPLLHRPPGLYRSVWKPLLGGGYVTNPVHALPFIHHQRSLTHHIDCCTPSQNTIPIIHWHWRYTADYTDHAHTWELSHNHDHPITHAL